MAQRRRTRYTIALLMIMSMVLAACGGDGEATTTTGGATTTEGPATTVAPTTTAGEAASTTMANAEPIIIGAAVAQSGGFELYDNEVLNGLRYAMDEVNADGGVLGRQLELIVGDHHTDVAQVASVTEELIGQGADVIVVTADYDFGAQGALAAAEAGKISIGGAGAPEFGYEGLGPLHFNVYQGTQTEAAVMAEWASEQGWSNAFLLIDTSIEYSKSLCELFEESWGALGGSISGQATFLNSDPSIASQISSIKGAADTDLVVLCSYPPGGASAVRQIRTEGVDLPIFGGAAYDGSFWLEAIPDLSNFYHPAMVGTALDDPNPAVNDFLEAVNPAGGAIYSLFGYTIVETIQLGAERAGSVDGNELAAGIETFDMEPLLTGPTTYTAECHIPVGRNMAIMQIQDGTPAFVEYVTPTEIPPAPC